MSYFRRRKVRKQLGRSALNVSSLKLYLLLAYIKQVVGSATHVMHVGVR